MKWLPFLVRFSLSRYFLLNLHLTKLTTTFLTWSISLCHIRLPQRNALELQFILRGVRVWHRQIDDFAILKHDWQLCAISLVIYLKMPLFQLPLSLTPMKIGILQANLKCVLTESKGCKKIIYNFCMMFLWYRSRKVKPNAEADNPYGDFDYSGYLLYDSSASGQD